MRPSVIVVAMCMLAACGGLAYFHGTREQATVDRTSASTEPQHETTPAGPSTQEPSTNVADENTKIAVSSPEADRPARSETAATVDPIAQLIKDTQSADAQTRAAAIAALADAPKARALPALEEVVQTGEPEVDRHIALRSMHALALRDGDTNGQIRDAIRHAIYHGDNDGVTQTAQSLLDDIEAEFAQREQNKN